ncbi:hypothetical protein ABZ639_11250 [Saccharomonospora sp. NPDC006951]
MTSSEAFALGKERPPGGRRLLPIVVVAAWSACYLVLGLVWAFGGSVAYPFDAGGEGSGDTLLDPMPVSAGGGVVAVRPQEDPR